MAMDAYGKAAIVLVNGKDNGRHDAVGVVD
jgi:hypothetical protein